MRRILLVLGESEDDRKSATAAVALAKSVGGQVEGLHIKIDPVEVLADLGEGLRSPAAGDVFKIARDDAEASSLKAKAILESVAGEAGVPFQPVFTDAPGPGVHFESVEGPALRVLDSRTDLADLVVFAEPTPTAPRSLLRKIEHTLLVVRRPILIARGKVHSSLGKRVLVAFKDTHEATNALMRAVPIIVNANATKVLHLHEDATDLESGKRAIRYLAQHGAKANLAEADSSKENVGETIAARAQTTQSDLIVMGGYGRSRMREFILGGATRYLLHHAPVPVLLAH